MTIEEAGRRLRAREVSSVELTSECLDAIEENDPLLNAFITVTKDRALADAANADARLAQPGQHPPLCGIPIALKDVFSTRGIRTTCGSRLFADHVPAIESAVGERLAQVGAVLVGKTGMHELAYGVTSNNPHFGAVANPRNPVCVPGGSSGGSATAVAAGMAFAAMGSDTGGSIRIPASYCGVVGLKPTSGRVSRYGVMPLDYSLDHMGPLTRTVRDCAIVMDAIAGRDERDDTSARHPVEPYLPEKDSSLKGLRLGWPENFFFDRIAKDVGHAMRAVASAAESLGGTIAPVRVPDIAAINIVGRVILMSEASACFDRYWDRREWFGEDVRLLLDQGRLLPATDYINAQRLRRVMQREFARLWDSIDLLLTPATPITAPRIGALTVDIEGQTEDMRIASTRFARWVNVLGLPALSIPAGVDAKGMPIGLQIIGPAFSEALVLRAGAAFEAAL